MGGNVVWARVFGIARGCLMLRRTPSWALAVITMIIILGNCVFDMVAPEWVNNENTVVFLN